MSHEIKCRIKDVDELRRYLRNFSTGTDGEPGDRDNIIMCFVRENLDPGMPREDYAKLPVGQPITVEKFMKETHFDRTIAERVLSKLELLGAIQFDGQTYKGINHFDIWIYDYLESGQYMETQLITKQALEEKTPVPILRSDIDEYMDTLDFKQELIKYFFSAKGRMQVMDIVNYLGRHRDTIKNIITRLNQLDCLTKYHTSWVKTKKFEEWLILAKKNMEGPGSDLVEIPNKPQADWIKNDLAEPGTEEYRDNCFEADTLHSMYGMAGLPEYLRPYVGLIAKAKADKKK
jgi:hypothetical protein